MIPRHGQGPGGIRALFLFHRELALFVACGVGQSALRPLRVLWPANSTHLRFDKTRASTAAAASLNGPLIWPCSYGNSGIKVSLECSITGISGCELQSAFKPEMYAPAAAAAFMALRHPHRRRCNPTNQQSSSASIIKGHGLTDDHEAHVSPRVAYLNMAVQTVFKTVV